MLSHDMICHDTGEEFKQASECRGFPAANQVEVMPLGPQQR